jgi:hypothetical protein
LQQRELQVEQTMVTTDKAVAEVTGPEAVEAAKLTPMLKWALTVEAAEVEVLEMPVPLAVQVT